MDDDKMKIIAHNVCREYYHEKADSRRQEVRDMAEEVLGVPHPIHHEHHISWGEAQRTNRVTKDTVNKTTTSLIVTTLLQALIMGAVVIAGVKLL